MALGGDVHAHVHGTPGPAGLHVRLARDNDDGRVLLATMPLALDTESRMTLPCGYFSRGGTYYLELVAEAKDNFLTEDFDVNSNSTANFAKRNVGDNNIKEVDNTEVDGDSEEIKEDVNRNKRKASIDLVNNVNSYGDVVSEQTVVSGSIIELGDTVVKSWKFDVLWPSANLKVTPEQIQTYPQRPVMAIIDFPKVVCTPLEASADFWLELLYCGHSSGGAVLCDGKNTSSHAHVLYSEQVIF